MATRREIVLGFLLGLFLSVISGVFKGLVSSGATTWISLAAAGEYCVAVVLIWLIYPIYVRRPYGARQVLIMLGLLSVYFAMGLAHSWITESTGIKAQPAYLFSWIFALCVVVGLRQVCLPQDGPSSNVCPPQPKS